MSQKFFFTAVVISSMVIIFLTVFLSMGTRKIEKQSLALEGTHTYSVSEAFAAEPVQVFKKEKPVTEELQDEEQSAWKDRALTPYGRYRMALQLRREGAWEDSIEALGMVIDAAPLFTKAYINRARAYLLTGENREAERDARKAEKIQPGNSSAFNILAIALERMGKFQEAKIAYQKAIEANPGYAWAYNNRGVYFLKRRSFREAYRDLSRAIRLDSTEPVFLNNMGQVYENLGHFARAREMYEKAVKISGDYPKASSSLARIESNPDFLDAVALEIENDTHLDGARAILVPDTFSRDFQAN